MVAQGDEEIEVQDVEDDMEVEDEEDEENEPVTVPDSSDDDEVLCKGLANKIIVVCKFLRKENL